MKRCHSIYAEIFLKKIQEQDEMETLVERYLARFQMSLVHKRFHMTKEMSSLNRICFMTIGSYLVDHVKVVHSVAIDHHYFPLLRMYFL